MILRPFFGYFGSKWSLAPFYPAPTHDTLIEPFAGSAGYALRYHQRRVILRDVDPIVCAIWRYLIGSSTADILALPDVPDEACVDDFPALSQEARWFIGMWLGATPTSPRKHPSAWMRRHDRESRFWGAQTRVRIARQLAFIKHWVVEEGSYHDAPPRRATWFVDPPYQIAGTKYRIGARKIDFADLGAWCRRLLGQVIVCEQTRATWLPFQPLAVIRCVAHGHTSAEACWLGEEHVGPVTLQQPLFAGGT